MLKTIPYFYNQQKSYFDQPMCYYTKQTKDATSLEKRFKANIKHKQIFKPQERINGFQHPYTPVITNNLPAQIQHLQWGLIPAWSKTDDIKKFTLNAKIETLHEKPSFKQVVNKRCLVLANGFYEWQWLDTKGKQKQQYHIYLPEQVAFAFGGLWSEWVNPQNGLLVQSYSIVTIPANTLMSKIHNSKKRMPLVLSLQNEQSWLQGASFKLFKQANVPLLAQPVGLKPPQQLQLF